MRTRIHAVSTQCGRLLSLFLIIGTLMAMSMGPAMATQFKRFSSDVPIITNDEVIVVDNYLLPPEVPGILQKAVKDIQEKHGVTVHIVLHSSIPETTQEWSEETADTNRDRLTKGKDAILGIFWHSQEANFNSLGYIPSDKEKAILENALYPFHDQPAIDEVDWYTVANNLVEGMDKYWTTRHTSVFSKVLPAQSSAGERSGSLVIAMISLLLIFSLPILCVVALILFLKKRKKKDPEALSATELEQMHDASRRLLIETDEALRQAREAVGQATADLGEQTTAPYKHAVNHAEFLARQAFSLRQELDDAFPESAQQQREMLVELTNYCHQVRELLSKHAEDFTTMRGIYTAPEPHLTSLTERIVSLYARIEPTETLLAEIIERYGDEPTAIISHNVVAARDNLLEAEKQVDFGRQVLTKTMDQRSSVVPAILQAEAMLDQAERLLDAVVHADEDISHAKLYLPQARENLNATLREVNAYVESLSQQNFGVPLEPITEACEEAKEKIEQSMTAADKEPLQVYRSLVSSDSALQEILLSTQAQMGTARRQSETVSQAIWTAQSQVRAATDAITARASFVQATARTRLSEAQQHLEAARQLRDENRLRALQEAQQAIQLAQQALTVAQNDEQAALAYQQSLYQQTYPSASTGNFVSGLLLGSLFSGGSYSGGSSSLWGLGSLGSNFGGGTSLHFGRGFGDFGSGGTSSSF